MKNIILFLILCFSVSQLLFCQNVDKQVISALENIAEGYVDYGVNQLRKVANMNDIAAQFYVGQCYEYGIGVRQSDSEAFKWYRRTAERGLSDGMLMLADFYSSGKGVAASQSRSSEWQDRFKKKGGNRKFPDLIEYYKLGQSHPENYALNPNGNEAASIPSVSQNGYLEAPILADKKCGNSYSYHETKPDVIRFKQNDTPKEKYVSDVDVDIPQTSIIQQNTFALIIANENYQEVERVANAINDGEVFAEYCRKTLGMPAENVHLVKDATMNNIRRKLNQFRDISNAYKGDVNIIFYYAGHGLPDESTRASYILPIDGFNADLATCISIDDIYSRLAEFGANKTVVFMDACFSGSLRGEGMLASARGIAIKPKVAEPRGNIIVLSACQGDETAYPYAEKGHGLMSYFLMKKLKESAGNVPLGELVDYVIDNVSKTAIVKNGKPQTPTVSVASSLSDKWRDLRLSF